jgi:hypothetical protein
LLTPPLASAPPPIKLRLRSRKTDSTTGDHGPARKRIVKRSAAVAQAPRGPNKRRRAIDDDDDDDAGRCSGNDSDTEQHGPLNSPLEGQDKENGARSGPHTPKRSRLAPEVIPLGLERADYHNLHHSSLPENVPADGSSDYRQEGTDVVVEADGEAWSTEEDRILVELVLEKLKLTKSDWQDCARSLGKDRLSVGRRWRSLIINGEVGLKRGSHRRGRIHGTWR